MKSLGVDYGEKRIGLAISDETNLLASPMPTLKVKSLADAVSKIQRIIRTQKVDKIVIGLPLGPNREETQQSIKTRYFGEAMSRANNIKIEYWNETLSTVQAKESTKKGTQRKKRNLDSEAARIILQEYLDFNHEPENNSNKLHNFELAVS